MLGPLMIVSCHGTSGVSGMIIDLCLPMQWRRNLHQVEVELDVVPALPLAQAP